MFHKIRVENSEHATIGRREYASLFLIAYRRMYVNHLGIISKEQATKNVQGIIIILLLPHLKTKAGQIVFLKTPTLGGRSLQESAYNRF